MLCQQFNASGDGAKMTTAHRNPYGGQAVRVEKIQPRKLRKLNKDRVLDTVKGVSCLQSSLCPVAFFFRPGQGLVWGQFCLSAFWEQICINIHQYSLSSGRMWVDGKGQEETLCPGTERPGLTFSASCHPP